MNRRWLIGVVSFVLLAATAVVYLASDELEAYFWNWTQKWELSEEQTQSIQNCSTLTWLTLARMQQQNISDTCSINWLAEQSYLVDDAFKMESLRANATDVSLKLNIRFRAHFLLLNKEARSPGFPIILDQIPERTRRAFLQWMVESTRDLKWLSPMMRHQIGIKQLELDLEGSIDVLHPSLLLEGLRHPMMVDVSYRDRLAKIALDNTGFLPDEILSGAELRKTDGSTFPFRVPPACNILSNPKCLVWLSQQLQSGMDEEWSTALDEVGEQSAFDGSTILERIFSQGPDLEDHFRKAIWVLWREYSDWFTSMMPTERWAVMYYWFFERQPLYGPTGEKTLNEMHPMSRTVLGASSPWVGLALLLELVPNIQVFRHNKELQVAIMVGPDGDIHQIGSCMISGVDVAVDMDSYVLLSKNQVGAHALLELASFAWTQGDIQVADQYLAAAQRWDGPLIGRTLQNIRFAESEHQESEMLSELSNLFTDIVIIPSLSGVKVTTDTPCATHAFGGQ